MTAGAPTTETRPLVSVVIPTWNCAEFLGEAVGSALGQEYPNREIIVVDDGSTDGTGELLQRFGGAIRTLSGPNQGVSAARNRGIAEARGTLVAFLDADDVWQPGKLAHQVRVMAAHPECAFLATDGVAFDEAGPRPGGLLSVLAKSWIDRHPAGEPGVGLGDLTEWLPFQNSICTSSVMVRREVLRAAGGFDPELSIAEDLDLWLRIAMMAPCGVSRFAGVRYRWRDESLSGKRAEKAMRWREGALRVLERRVGALRPEQQGEVHRHMAGEYWQAGLDRLEGGDLAAARERWRASRRHDPKAVSPLTLLWISAFGRAAARAALRLRAAVVAGDR